MKYYINGVACSVAFECCGQLCLSVGDGVLIRGAEVCYFMQTPPRDEAAADRARMACPAGAIRIEQEVEPEPPEGWYDF